mgnify:CR=1 FL=1
MHQRPLTTGKPKQILTQWDSQFTGVLMFSSVPVIQCPFQSSSRPALWTLVVPSQHQINGLNLTQVINDAVDIGPEGSLTKQIYVLFSRLTVHS